MKTGRKYDLAYACFLFCGLAALIASVMEAIPKDDGTAALLGFFVAVPLVIASFAAIVTATVLSMQLWRHWPLLILCGVSVLAIAVFLMAEGVPKAFYYAVAVLYGVSTVTVSGLWFLVLRRRHFPATVKESQRPA
jgi:hypothetical protein